MKNGMDINNRQKTGLNQQRLFQMFDLIYTGLTPFLSNVILFRIIQIFKTACKIDPHYEAAVGWALWLWFRQIETGSRLIAQTQRVKKIANISIQRFRVLVL